MRDLHKKKTKAEPGNTSAFTRCWEERVNKGDQKEKISEKKEEHGVRTTKGQKVHSIRRQLCGERHEGLPRV